MLFFIALFYFIVLSLSFPRLFPDAYLYTSPGRKRKSPECQPMAQMPSLKKANWPPGPCANFQELTMESMPVLPLKESCPKYTFKYIYLAQQ
jgi:hypothetical protein